MKTDFTADALSSAGHAAKAATRRMPLEAAMESSTLWRKDGGYLTRDWLELAGHHAPTLQLLLDEGALDPARPARFIGIDSNPAVIAGCRSRYGAETPASWHIGQLESLVTARGAFPNVGVLVYDTEDGVWGTKWDALGRVARFAQRQADAIGEFILVVNVVADPRYATPAAIDRYLTQLSDAVGHRVEREALHRYTSSTVPMLWTMVTFGF